VKGGSATTALNWVGDGLSSRVMVVTEFFLTEAWACAAASVGEDVAALVLFGCFGICIVHVPPTGAFWCKVFEREEMSLDCGSLVSLFSDCPGDSFFGVLRLNAKARLLAGLLVLSFSFFYLVLSSLFSFYFYFNELSQTKTPLFANLFFGCR
jgi:hypothetical protein